MPAAACAVGLAHADAQLTACDGVATKRAGEWRYALIAPLYSPVEDITVAELAALWQGRGKRGLAIAPETRDVLAAQLGPARAEVTSARPQLTPKRWAIVPAEELVPQWKVITVDGKHPLVDDSPLAVPLCAPVPVDVHNIEPDELTTVAMTGVTAMARFTAKLMDDKGVTYPARDVASWFARTDFVHVNNEVSFVRTCEPKGEYVEPFCSRESYIGLLEALHVNIVELTGDHLADHGTKWLTHSIEMYEARGWKTFGGGRDQLAATRPLLVEHNGNKLAFIGCNIPRSRKETIRNGPENAFCDGKRLDWEVRDLRARGYLPIISLQHDETRGHDPPKGLVRDFRRLAEHGAAAVFGSQAHVAHPFEVHAGAYLHYGAGNFIFDQPWMSTRDGTAVRYYIHRGRLLSVAHLFTHIEEQGRPRPMNHDERATFLATLAESLATVPGARPWLEPQLAPPERHAPDSFLVGNSPVLLRVARPAAPSGQRYPLVIDLRARTASADDAFTVTLRKWPPLRKQRLVRAITDFMASKYPIDRARVTIR